VFLAVVPVYWKGSTHPGPPHTTSYPLYLSAKEAVGKTAALPDPPVGSPRQATWEIRSMQVRRTMPLFYPSIAQHIQFQVSEWPTSANIVRDGIAVAIDTFIEIVRARDNS
jgi:hypothetical protein